jgi:putative chitinase
MFKITANQATSLKWDWALQSHEQPPNHVIKCVFKDGVGKTLTIENAEIAPDGKHAKVYFQTLNVTLNGVVTPWKSGYLYIPHWPKLQELFPANPPANSAIWGSETLEWKPWLKAYSLAIKPAAQPVTKAAGLPSINVTTETWLKTEPIDSSKLSDSQKLKIKPGTLICTVIGSQAGHARVKMPDGSLRYIFNKHFSGQETECKLSTPVSKTGNFCIDHATLIKAIGAVAADSIPDSEIEMIACALEKYGPDFGVNSKLQVCHLIPQLAHESSGFRYTEEIGDFDYFESNYGIAVRDDLGNEVYGDGAKYCGRGLICVTGLHNYKKLAAKMKNPLIVSTPEIVSEYPLAMVSALSWWEDNDMRIESERGVSEADMIAVTKVINGGTMGLEERIRYTHKVAKILGL